MGFRKILLLLLSLFCVVAACDKKDTVSQLPPRAVKAYHVQSYARLDTRRFSGLVEAEDKIDLSFQVPGRIEMINTKIGVLIKQGDVLAKLDDKTYQLEVTAAKAQLQQAKAAEIEATTEYRAKAKLYGSNHVSLLDFKEAESNYNIAKSNVNLFQSKLDIAQDNLSKTILYAPFDGSITDDFADVHSDVDPGDSVLAYEGLHIFEVEVNIPDSLVERVHVNDTVKIDFISADGMILDGTVTEIGASTKIANAYPVIVTFKNPPPQIRSGMTVDVIFNLKFENGNNNLTIPINAILPGHKVGEAYVFVIDPKTMTLIKTKVHAVGLESNLIRIKAGLKEGDIIANSGVRFLRDGQKVRYYQGK